MKFIAIQKEGKTFQLIYITSLQVYVQKVGLINYIYYFSTVLYLCICMKPHINEAYVYVYVWGMWLKVYMYHYHQHNFLTLCASVSSIRDIKMFTTNGPLRFVHVVGTYIHFEIIL